MEARMVEEEGLLATEAATGEETKDEEFRCEGSFKGIEITTTRSSRGIEMALYKRKKTWWTDFCVNGQRFRQSLDTSDWRAANHCEKELIARAREGKLTAAGQSFARLAFPEAFQRYLADRKTCVAPRSHRSESDHAKPLVEYFSATPVARVSAEAILVYIRQRKEKEISNVTINMEVGILRRVLKRAKRWSIVADDVPRLPERRDIGRAMSHEEKARLLLLSAAKPEWMTARLAVILALNTTMRGCELKGLCWRDVDFIERTITIRRSKTAAGERVIPLNAEAWNTILQLRARAIKLFGENLLADWHLFPHAEGYSKPDPTKPMSGWRSAWRSLTRAIQCPACGQLQQPAGICANAKCKADTCKLKSPLHGLRFHDLRHHAITELAESQTSERTIMAIAGHVSPKMLDHYSHVRMQAKRQALDALSGKFSIVGKVGESTEGYGTKHATNSKPERMPFAEVLEKNGGDDETRTRDLCRDSTAF
jgi:integrase